MWDQIQYQQTTIQYKRSQSRFVNEKDWICPTITAEGVEIEWQKICENSLF